MAELQKNHIRTNPQKEQKILELFYEENFRKKDKALFEKFIVSKVNLATNQTIEDASIAGASDYTFQIANKKTARMTKQVITIKPNEPGFNLLFYSGTNYYDKSNPQVGRKNNDTRADIKHQLSLVNKAGRTHVLFGGDILGNEWEIKYLRNAEIVDGKICYFGINKRKERLVSDIKAYFNLAKKMGIENIDIYLMRGAQEHKIQKELGRDIMQEVCDELNSPQLHYIDEGVSLGMNVVKKGTKTKYGILGLQTNQTGKATTIKGANASSIKDNGDLIADLTFRCNSNVIGKLSGKEIYNVSTQSSYVRTAKMQKPGAHARYFNMFWVNLEDNNEFSVVDGGTKIFDDNLALEKQKHLNELKKQILLDCCLKTIEKHLNIAEESNASEEEYGK